jgi:hypothetical protein
MNSLLLMAWDRHNKKYIGTATIKHTRVSGGAISLDGEGRGSQLVFI